MPKKKGFVCWANKGLIWNTLRIDNGYMYENKYNIPPKKNTKILVHVLGFHTEHHYK